MTHRRRVDALIQAFLGRSPDPSGQVTEAFALFAVTRGARVRIVHAEDAEDPAHGRHTWVRVFNEEGIHGYDVDFTAGRQQDGDLPDPLVWRMDGQHPVAGVYRTMTVTPAT